MGQPEVVSRQSSVVSSLGRAVGDEAWAGEPDTSVDLELTPGRIFGLIGPAGSGLTSVGLSLIAAATTSKEPVAVLDGRGWFCPPVAWDVGIDPQRLVVIRCPDRTVWPTVAAALFEGFPAVFADVPRHISDQSLRRLAALARSRRAGVVLRTMSGDLPSGVLHLRLEGVAVRWDGPELGHGRLQRRAVTIKASGKGARGIERYLEVEEAGAHTMRLVPGLAPAPPGRAIG